MQLNLFGPFPTVTIDSIEVKFRDCHYFRLLAYVAAMGGDAGMSEVCATLFQGDNDPRRRIYQSCGRDVPHSVKDILASLGETSAKFIKIVDRWLTLDSVACDLLDFWKLAEQARQQGDPKKALRAIELYDGMASQGTFLANMENERGWKWVSGVRSDLLAKRNELADFAVMASAVPIAKPAALAVVNVGQRAVLDWEAEYRGLSEEGKSAVQLLYLCPSGASVGRTSNAVPGMRELVQRGLAGLLPIPRTARYQLNADFRNWLSQNESALAGLDAVRDEHVAKYLSKTLGLANRIAAPNNANAMNQLVLEYENICVAIEWALHQNKGDGLKFCYCLQNYWGAQPNMMESFLFCERIIRQSKSSDDLILAKALKCAGVLAYYLNQYSSAMEYYRRGIETLERLQKDPKKEVPAILGILNIRNDIALVEMEMATWDPQKYHVAKDQYQKILRVREDLKSKLDDKGDLEKNSVQIAWAHLNLGMVQYYEARQFRTDDFSLATKSLKTSRSQCERQESENVEGIANCSLFLAKCSLGEGNLITARQLAHQALTTFANDVGDLRSQIEALDCVAHVAAMSMNLESAARLLGATHAQRGILNLPLRPQERAEYEKFVLPLIREFGQSEFNRRFFSHGFVDFAEAMAYGQNLAWVSVQRLL